MQDKEKFLRERKVRVGLKEIYLKTSWSDHRGFYRNSQKRKRDLAKWIKKGRPVYHTTNIKSVGVM